MLRQMLSSDEKSIVIILSQMNDLNAQKVHKPLLNFFLLTWFTSRKTYITFQLSSNVPWKSLGGLKVGRTKFTHLQGQTTHTTPTLPVLALPFHKHWDSYWSWSCLEGSSQSQMLVNLVFIPIPRNSTHIFGALIQCKQSLQDKSKDFGFAEVSLKQSSPGITRVIVPYQTKQCTVWK